MTSKPEQHELSVEVRGQWYEGRYTLEPAERKVRLTVWFRGRHAIDADIVPWAEPTSTEYVAENLLSVCARSRSRCV